MTAPATLAVQARSLEKSFGEWPVLWDLDLSVPWGQTLVLFGANGAGKTTLLRILATHVRPDHGSVAVAGHNLRTRPEEIRRRIGVVGHRSLLYDDLTCRENLVYYGRLYGLKDHKKRVDEVLEKVRLTSRADHRVRTLSNGMQKRASIARAILHQPDVLLLDEPEAGLHPSLLPIVADMIKTASERTQVLVSTHSPDLLSCFDLDDIAVMARDEARAIWRRPRNRATLRKMLESVAGETLGDLHRSGELEAYE